MTGHGAAWLRGERAEAGRVAAAIAADLGVDVAPHPLMRHRYEAAFGGTVLVGTGEEVRLEARRALMRDWVAVLGRQGGGARGGHAGA